MVTTNPINSPQLPILLQSTIVSKQKQTTTELRYKLLKQQQQLILWARKERKAKSNSRRWSSLKETKIRGVMLPMFLVLSNHPVQPFNQSKWHQHHLPHLRLKKVSKIARTSSKAQMQLKKSGTWRLSRSQRKPIVLPNYRQAMMSRAAMSHKTKMEGIKLLSTKKRVPMKTTHLDRVSHRRSNSRRLVKHYSSLKSILRDFSSLAHLEFWTAVIKTKALVNKFAWLTQRRKHQMTFLRIFWWRRFRRRTKNADLSRREAKAKPKLISISRESE